MQKQIRAIYDHDVHVHWQHSTNIRIHDQSYKTAFNKIMLNNPCKLIVALDDPEAINLCESYLEGTVTQGMTVAFTRHFENMKQMEAYYWFYKDNPDSPFIRPADEAGGKDMDFR